MQTKTIVYMAFVPGTTRDDDGMFLSSMQVQLEQVPAKWMCPKGVRMSLPKDRKSVV